MDEKKCHLLNTIKKIIHRNNWAHFQRNTFFTETEQFVEISICSATDENLATVLEQ